MPRAIRIEEWGSREVGQSRLTGNNFSWKWHTLTVTPQGDGMMYHQIQDSASIVDVLRTRTGFVLTSTIAQP
jgi:hypothetical protein